MQSRARVVVIGSGIAGSSIAYHLAEYGWRDVVVLEQGKLISGTTSHPPGLVGQMRTSASLVKLLMYSVSLYRQLRVDGEAGFFEVGSLRVASSPERLLEIKRLHGYARAVGLPAELLSPREAQKLFPLMTLDGVEGALYFPTDGSARASVLAQGLLNGARERGVTFYEHTTVTGFNIRREQVHGVITDKGAIETDHVVLASGIWSPHIGRLAGVSIPLTPMLHQWCMTEPLAGLDPAKPVANMRDPDNLIYCRQDGQSLSIGGYEHTPKTFEVGHIPKNDNPTVHTSFDHERYERLMVKGRNRIPQLKDVKFIKQINGMESFTPDGDFIMGEAPDIRGFWVACGFCAHGVSGGGGVGKAMAEWIIGGEPSLDLWHMDIRRFGPHTTGKNYIQARATEVYKHYYSISYPGQEKESMRGLRTSPVYARLKEIGAVFGEKYGWERPLCFASNETDSAEFVRPRGWAGKYWSSAIGVEHKAAREAVALFDESSFSKIELKGRGALAVLQNLAANQMDQKVGTVIYTQMLNERGGIECDLTVTRLAEEHFLIITGTAFGTHDLSWIRRHLPSDGSVEARDITSSLCCFGVMGPRSREVLSQITETDMSNAAFPFRTAQRILLDSVPVLAVRITYVGELGWELYAPTEFGNRLWSVLETAGKPFDIRPAGYKAIDSLRLEKGYRYWSGDIDIETHPYQSGLGFAVKLDKANFIGRDALVKIRAEGNKRKLCCLVLDDTTAVALGSEAVLANDEVVGRVTSGGFGYAVNRSIAYTYLPVALAMVGQRVEVLCFGEHIGATVSAEPLYDPKNEKIRA